MSQEPGSDMGAVPKYMGLAGDVIPKNFELASTDLSYLGPTGTLDPRNVGVARLNPRSQGLVEVSDPGYLGLEGNVISKECEYYYYYYYYYYYLKKNIITIKEKP